MRHLLNELYSDETGAIISAEFIIIATVVVLALVTGWNVVSGALVGELADVANAFGGLDQSYNYRGVTALSNNGTHATCSGGGFNDSGNQIAITTNTQTIAGGIAGTGFTAGGAIGFSGGGNINIAGGADVGAAANGAGVGVGAAAPSAAAGAFGAPGAALSEGNEIRADRLGVVASASNDEGVIVSRVLVDQRPAAATSRAANADECDLLKQKIRELCGLLNNSTPNAAPTNGGVAPQGSQPAVPALQPIPADQRAPE